MAADRLRALCAALLLAGCSVADAPPSPPVPLAASVAGLAPQCRVGADGGPLVSDRGIGGTGSPPVSAIADRGIGGTGIERTGVERTGVERTGVERTGLLGVITGFASICLGGQEIGYDPATQILIDAKPGRAADLRAGQLAAIEAAGPAAGLVARRVTVRHEVTGPVEAIEPGPILRIAGQRVAVAAATLGERAPPVGAWVAVSGFRDPDGIIHATRLDPHAPGEALITGVLLRENGRPRIGTAEIVSARGVLIPSGPTVLRGRYADGILYVDSAEPDRLAGSPSAYFGPAFVVVVSEGFAGIMDGRLVVHRETRRGMDAPVSRVMVELSRRTDGALQTAARALAAAAGRFDRGAPLPGPTVANARTGPAPRTLEPAPMPRRDVPGEREGNHGFGARGQGRAEPGSPGGPSRFQRGGEADQAMPQGAIPPGTSQPGGPMFGPGAAPGPRAR